MLRRYEVNAGLPYGLKAVHSGPRQSNRGMQLGLISDETLRKIASDVVEIVCRDAQTDLSIKAQLRAELRSTNRLLLQRYGYPPDKEQIANPAGARTGRGPRQ